MGVGVGVGVAAVADDDDGTCVVDAACVGVDGELPQAANPTANARSPKHLNPIDGILGPVTTVLHGSLWKLTPGIVASHS